MSRIDEALQRTKALRDDAATNASQSNFVAAWPIGTPAGSTSSPVEAGTLASAPAARAPSVGPALGFSSEWRQRLASAPDGDPALVEQFRRLAATLHHAQRANGIRSVMVTSAQPGDGKTLTAINLAIVLAESYRYNVLLMDADLRRPSIPSVVELQQGTGLSEALRSSSQQKLALVPLTPRLTLLPAGQPIANSIEALTSPRMRLILEEAASRFDWVVLDAPPVGQTADARLLAELVEGTLFVIHAGKTQHGDVQKAIDALGREQILGIVLNGVDTDHAEGYYYSTPRPSETA